MRTLALSSIAVLGLSSTGCIGAVQIENNCFRLLFGDEFIPAASKLCVKLTGGGTVLTKEFSRVNGDFDEEGFGTETVATDAETDSRFAMAGAYNIEVTFKKADGTVFIFPPVGDNGRPFRLKKENALVGPE